ncbi:MAG: 4-(cytidine 5'-diphospho)-2-C-methyl-D-erythritol kinase [Desulfobacteraceae bacterium]
MELLAPAKINLYLRVVGRRSDGYHELQSLMCCIGLHDTVKLRMGSDQNGISCSDSDLPSDESNLALKAALHFNGALKAETRIVPQNAFIHLTKRIPSGAGLGGGSSDAAAVLKGLNGYYGHPFDQPKIMAMALKLGADVPFFIDGRPALATGVGEVLSPYNQLPSWGVVVVYPGFGISTAEVFKNLSFGLTKGEKPHRYFPFKQGKFDRDRHLCNDLESVAIRQFPVIGKIKNKLLNQGANGALMTGSGSAVFGLFADLAAAQKAAKAMTAPAQWQVFATQLVC